MMTDVEIFERVESMVRGVGMLYGRDFRRLCEIAGRDPHKGFVDHSFVIAESIDAKLYLTSLVREAKRRADEDPVLAHWMAL